MKKPHITLLTIAFLMGSLILTGCTGYSDGPVLSLKSAKTKISTTWRVKDASLFGVEVTSSYDQDFFKFEEDGDFSYFDASRLIAVPPFTQDTIMPLEGVGEWQFLDGSKQLEVLYTFSFKDPYNPDITYTEDVNQRWEVTRLAEGELWLRDDSTILKLEFY
ncbi:MAG: hypothetical protein SF052_27090 [Bacteroidia bacterium]|nr:hypothetical protein [Bacteroidia bacterium]